MLMNYRVKQLKALGKFKNHPRFMIKTTASALSWDEWAKAHGIKVVNVPVGFKEIANIMKKLNFKLKIIRKAKLLLMTFLETQLIWVFSRV